MADYSLQDFWWNKPSRTESQLPALQLGVQIVQNKAAMDLRERQLADDMARTEIARAESMAKIQLQTSISAGNAEMAQAASRITDWSDVAQMKPIYDLGARYGSLVGTKGWDGIINTHERAVNAKRMSLNTESLIAQREARTELGMARLELQELLADSTVDLNDARILDLQNDIAFAERRAVIQEGNLELRREELSQKGKRLSIRSQRMYDNELKALNNEETAALKNATGDEAKRLRVNFNLRRRALTAKFYPDTESAPRVEREGLAPRPAPAITPPTLVPPPGTNAPSASVAPESNPRAAEIKAAFRAGKITREQAEQQLRELGFE